MKSVSKKKIAVSGAKKKRARAVVDGLKTLYPDASCALQYEGDPFRLLVMGRLSAQCTDARVNLVCKELFSRFPDARAMAHAPIEEIERIVRPCGLFRVKAADIKNASRMLTEQFNGVLPSDMETLLQFPGVGRKIANLLRGDLFGLPAVVADTHCIRICGRLGFYPESEKRPEVVEKVMTALLPPEESSDFCHRIVQFGRDICTARAPSCDRCPLPCPHHRKKSGGASQKTIEDAR